jgi:predicted GNAT superfamily acetyltransferase
MTTHLRAVSIDDLAVLRLLNEAATPHVNSIRLAEFDWFRVHAPYFRVAEQGGNIVGFLTALTPELPYASPNFEWFQTNRDRFVYIDRIVVTESARGSGVGRRLYRDVAEFAAPFANSLTCEVNIRPANPGSVAFHQRMGFREVGRQETEGGKKEVMLLEKELEDVRHALGQRQGDER